MTSEEKYLGRKEIAQLFKPDNPDSLYQRLRPVFEIIESNFDKKFLDKRTKLINEAREFGTSTKIDFGNLAIQINLDKDHIISVKKIYPVGKSSGRSYYAVNAEDINVLEDYLGKQVLNEVPQISKAQQIITQRAEKEKIANRPDLFKYYEDNFIHASKTNNEYAKWFRDNKLELNLDYDKIIDLTEIEKINLLHIARGGDVRVEEDRMLLELFSPKGDYRNYTVAETIR